MWVNESMRVPGHSKPRKIRTRAARARIYNSNGESSVPEARSRVARTPLSRTWGTLSRGYMLHTKWPWPSHTKSQLLLLLKSDSRDDADCTGRTCRDASWQQRCDDRRCERQGEGRSLSAEPWVPPHALLSQRTFLNKIKWRYYLLLWPLANYYSRY